MLQAQIMGTVCLLVIGHFGVKAGFTLMGAIWLACLGLMHRTIMKDLWIHPLYFDPQGLKNYVVALKFHTQTWPHVGPYFIGIIVGFVLECRRDQLSILYHRYRRWILPVSILEVTFQFKHPAYVDPLLSPSYPQIVALFYALDYMLACVPYLALMLYFVHNPGRPHPVQALWAYHQKLMLTYFWLHIPFSIAIASHKRDTAPIDETSLVSFTLIPVTCSFTHDTLSNYNVIIAGSHLDDLRVNLWGHIFSPHFICRPNERAGNTIDQWIDGRRRETI